MIMSAQQVSCTLCSSLKYKSSNNALQAAWYSKIFQVVVLSCVLMIQVINGITSSNVSFNALLQTNEPQEPFQVHSNGFSWIIIFIFMKLCLPFHLQFLGSLTSCFVLPFLLHWGRIKTLSLCTLLFIVTNIFFIFSSTSSWTLRLSEFLAGFSSGLTSPALNIYSSEVFTEKRFNVLILWKENIFCCIIEDQSSRQWSVCWNCLENVSPPSSSPQSVTR